MEQLAWTLSHHIGERLVRRGYHIFFERKPWGNAPRQEEATILACLQGAQTNSFSNLNRGNSLLKRDKRSKLK
jgi:hypothetical protein